MACGAINKAFEGEGFGAVLAPSAPKQAVTNVGWMFVAIEAEFFNHDAVREIIASYSSGVVGASIDGNHCVSVKMVGIEVVSVYRN